MGLTSYFEKFVRCFSKVAKPLTDWTKQPKVFQRLKAGVGEESILAVYNPKMKLLTDVSKLGLETILIRLGNQGVEG